MRKKIFALTAIFLAPTTVMALAGGEWAGGPGPGATQGLQIAAGEGFAINQGDYPKGTVILAKGDQSGSGPGHGGHKGQKKGGHHGKQKEGKDNKDKKS